MTKELLDFDLAFRLVAIDHVAENESLTITIIFILNNQYDVHFDETDLTNVAQLESLHVLKLRLIVKQVESVSGCNRDHVYILKH